MTRFLILYIGVPPLLTPKIEDEVQGPARTSTIWTFYSPGIFKTWNKSQIY